jgi:sirohydrochlorin cobaltochelatase
MTRPSSPCFPTIGPWQKINDSVPDTGQTAILLSSFGTSWPAARKETIDAVEQMLRKTWPDMPVFQCYTSHMIAEKVRKTEGLIRYTPEEALSQLKSMGFTRVFIISLAVIPGMEYEYMANAAKASLPLFHSVSMTTPLLYFQGAGDTPDQVVEFLQALQPSLPPVKENEATLLMAHGTSHPANAYYAVIEDRIRRLGWPRVHVYTVEGTPCLDDVIPLLRQEQVRRVHLFPLMLTAGDHAHNDMAGPEEDSHMNILRAAGFDVSFTMKGLGEYEPIRQLILNRAKEIMGFPSV